MPHEAADRNPFMLMLNPEMILAAIEKSERLGQLNRHLCRPLDRPAPTSPSGAAEAARAENDDAAGNDFS
ncbi:MAG TPA: hypothetical protein VK570_16205 [Rubrivivax sp.]|jgi:hypothetical protein|nr:hypothetical protein [Rubrivivax sp.]